jgi:hypothetical protein
MALQRLAALALALLASPAGGAEPARPAPAPLVAEALVAGVPPAPLAREGETIVEPGATFRVVLPGRSDDARLSLLDAADVLVPALLSREVGAQTVLTLSPAKPLLPAGRYLLRVDGAAARDLHDAAGRPAGPVELRLLVAGKAPEPPPSQPAKRARRR